MPTINQRKALVLDPLDNVAVALAPLVAGETITVTNSKLVHTVTLRTDIPIGHKVALCPIKSGDLVIKYGQPVGKVTTDVRAGEHVHIHNVVSTRAG
jgi:altronate dehydratase